MNKLASVLERDIDLLILEEFHCSKKFQNWFILDTLGENAESYEFLGAWHSVTNPVLGESDLEIEFKKKDGSRLRVLIENKIDAIVQPEQGIRYIKRGQEYLAKSACDRFVTVLMCPAEYLEGLPEAEEFDFTWTYESIRDWFLLKSGLEARGEHKAYVISAGIEEARRGYQPLIDNKVTNFWEEYWKQVSAIAPELEMKKPTAKPEGSSFVAFKPSTFPRNMRIVHKLRHGNVDLEFSGMAERVSELKEKYQPSLEKGMLFTRAGKSAAIRIKVPAVETSGDFDAQLDVVREGIENSKALFVWVEKHIKA